jgi:transposase
MNSQNSSPADSFAAFVGVDWAERQHAFAILEPGATAPRGCGEFAQQPEAIAAWADDLKRRYGGRPVAVAVELSRGPLVHALRDYQHLVLFPINPKQFANYRKAIHASEKKDDATDARLLARFLREHHENLRRWQPDEPLTRQLAALCEQRRKLVEDRKNLGQRLRHVLLAYFPLVLELVRELHHPLALELLRRWPTLKQLQRAKPERIRKLFRGMRRGQVDVVEQIRAARPLTEDPAIIEPNALYVQSLVKQMESLNQAIEQFEERIRQAYAKHPDAELYRSLPGAGEALGPRLLTAMGDDRERYETAANLQSYSGIAPVTKQSGKSKQVHRRYACPRFLRQTFHEFADHARKWSGWSKAYYNYLRSKGQKHHSAVRALAFKWIRILFRIWQDRVPYDETRYVNDLKTRNSPVAKLLENS